ncbi:hypothetical protein AYR66_02550 [Noviherbaspirillum denitrificans]|uniref:LysM domain-containing protein n=2 Tax=Noviherbaspirillum denitrificans TaxID=1968433 RepID=A0A254T6Y0_9BURK|nr:hypothetical protein AYR66_02550 [Noviherbaspirillum denitrificans]
MLYVYAPPKENDTEGYIEHVCKRTGFEREKVIRHFSDAELEKLMSAMEEREGYHHKKETRNEIWIHTTSVAFSNGASPIADLPIKLVRDGIEFFTRTNAFGMLSPLVHHKIGDRVEMWVEDAKKEWQKIETLALGDKSQAFTFVRDFLIVKANTASHNPVAGVTKRPEPVRYVVQPNDTLSKIAKKFKVEPSKIKRDNGIKNSNLIMPGEVVVINKSSSESASRGNDVMSASPRRRGSIEKTLTTERSKDGKGHPIALIQVDQKRAPWMEFAIREAKRWAGKKEDDITKERNYHRLVDPKNGLSSLIGKNNPWCASFVNWCLKQAGYPLSHSPASSQSFLNDKNFVKLDQPVYGAIVVWSNYVEATGKPDGTGHVGFLYGANAVLGGNQSDAINFKGNADSTWTHKSQGKMLQKIRGYYVPLAYAEFALRAEEKSQSLTEKLPRVLNNEFGFSSAGVATR